MDGQADWRIKECMEERLDKRMDLEFTNGQADGWTDKPIQGFSVLEDSITASKHIFQDQESQNT